MDANNQPSQNKIETLTISDSLQKSPLRYPGGKSRAVDLILSFIPKDEKEIVCPFLGGGSIELACASAGLKVYGSDIFKPLISFWHEIIKDPLALTKTILKYHPISKSAFVELQKKLPDIVDQHEQGAVFFVVNRSSFSGSTLSGGMSPNHPRFNLSSIERVTNFKIKNLFITECSFKEALSQHPDILSYLDPPYFIKSNLYGVNGSTHRDFDHQELAQILKTRNNWILSYNDCPFIRELYQEYKFFTPSWKYGMSANKNSKEVIIISHDLAKKLNI
jgi:DNA adenine methylase